MPKRPRTIPRSAAKKRRPTPRAVTPRALDGVPGTVVPGFREKPITDLPVPEALLEGLRVGGYDAEAFGVRYYEMGACEINVWQKVPGPNQAAVERMGMFISCESRHPSWDEVKVARYRLLPEERAFALLLPPPPFYLDSKHGEHAFILFEIDDPLRPWEPSIG